MTGAIIAALWGGGTLAVLFYGGAGARGWAEHGAISVAALLWPLALTLLVAVMVSDWRLARRNKGRIF